jgi:hypothetical protein
MTANSIITPQTIKSACCNVATANTTFTTSPTNTVGLVSAGALGARVTKIQAIPCETVTAAFLQVYRQPSGLTTKYLALAAVCGSDTVSGTDGPVVIDFGVSDDNPLLMHAGETLLVATGISKSFNFIAEWADY